MNEQQGASGLTAATYADMLDEFASECERIGQQQAYTIRGYAQPSVERGLKLKAALIERDQAKDAALARERRRVEALQSRIDWTFEALDAHQRGRQGTGEEIADDDIIDMAIALLMDGDDADAPGQGGEGGDR